MITNLRNVFWHTIHGWMSDQTQFTELSAELERAGVKSQALAYGKQFGGRSTANANKRAGYELARRVRAHPEVQHGVIAHSNGGLVTQQALNYGVPLVCCIFINPALDKDISTAYYPDTLEKIHVLHHRRDRAVFAAQFRRNSDWGAMGRYGYTGTDPIYENWDVTDEYSTFLNHSYLLKNPRELATRLRHLMDGDSPIWST